MKLRGMLVPVPEITSSRRDEMFLLMDRHYQNVTKERFLTDLAEKQWVILLLDPQTDRLCGFSTQMLVSLRAAGEPVHALFSGDTIVAADHWGDIALSHVWGRLALSLMDQVAPDRLFWFLISKGYKTYRFLPLFFREFYPRHEMPTPRWAQEMIATFGRHKFADAFDPAVGLIRASGQKDRLRPGVADVTDARLHDPHVRFFTHRNPGHASGDELCCIAPLTRENFTPAAYRVIEAKPIPAGRSDACRRTA